MDLELMGRVAIVTGGSMGTGKACVEALASQGVRVATCARGIEALTAAAEEICSKAETEVLPIQADLTNPEDVKRFIATAFDKFGRIESRSTPFIRSPEGLAGVEWKGDGAAKRYEELARGEHISVEEAHERVRLELGPVAGTTSRG